MHESSEGLSSTANLNPKGSHPSACSGTPIIFIRHIPPIFTCASIVRSSQPLEIPYMSNSIHTNTHTHTHTHTHSLSPQVSAREMRTTPCQCALKCFDKISEEQRKK